MEPQVASRQVPHVDHRAGNFAVAVSRSSPAPRWTAKANPEEYMVILPPGGASATIEAVRETIDAKPDSLTIVPPGEQITATSKGSLRACC